jgi:hypothetical protein
METYSEHHTADLILGVGDFMPKICIDCGCGFDVRIVVLKEYTLVLKVELLFQGENG